MEDSQQEEMDTHAPPLPRAPAAAPEAAGEPQAQSPHEPD